MSVFRFNLVPQEIVEPRSAVISTSSNQRQVPTPYHQLARPASSSFPQQINPAFILHEKHTTPASESYEQQVQTASKPHTPKTQLITYETQSAPSNRLLELPSVPTNRPLKQVSSPQDYASRPELLIAYETQSKQPNNQHSEKASAPSNRPIKPASLPEASTPYDQLHQHLSESYTYQHQYDQVKLVQDYSNLG